MLGGEAGDDRVAAGKVAGVKHSHCFKARLIGRKEWRNIILFVAVRAPADSDQVRGSQ